MVTHTRIQELANNSEIENSRNKSHAKISEFTVGQGHPRVMIYKKFVELHCLMLHDKFQNHRPSDSGEKDF